MIARIYRITNRETQQSYVGYTSKTVAERWKKHVRQATTSVKNSNSIFYQNIRQYGATAFDVEELYASLDIDHCHDVMEQYFITNYDTMHPNGFNCMPGGKQTPNKKNNTLCV